MVILKYVSWTKKQLLLFVIAVLTTSNILYADTDKAIEILKKTYELESLLNSKDAGEIIESLGAALKDCEDKYIAFRIKYRIGVIYFKAGLLDQASEQFLKITKEAECPDDIKAFSFNMMGQLSRMKGKNEVALDSFLKSSQGLETLLSKDIRSEDSAIVQVLRSVLISRAEIFELQKKYDNSIEQYNHLLEILNRYKKNEHAKEYIPLVSDRISQLYLRQGKTEQYVTSVQNLTHTNPEYIRTPIMKMELTCVKILKNISDEIEFARGSYESPAMLIQAIKKADNKDVFVNCMDEFKKLFEEYKDKHMGILLQYHYAWFMDTMGEKDEARKIFAEISLYENKDANNSREEPEAISTIQDYAKIQYAIMAGEKGEYNEALKVLNGLRTHPEDSHLSELAKSVEESIQILKREVKINEN